MFSLLRELGLPKSPRRLAWKTTLVVRVSLCLALLLSAGCFSDFVTSVHAEWKVRPKRWKLIARRLETSFLQRPQQGYTLKRLLLHYKRRGGYKAILQRLSNPKTTPARTTPHKRKLALALIALEARDTKRAFSWLKATQPLRLRSLLSPDATGSLSTNQRATLAWLRYWAKANFVAQRWRYARRAYQLLLTPKLPRQRQIHLRQKLLILDEKEGRWNQVQLHYKALSKLQPKEPSHRRSRARVLLRLGKASAALQELQQALPQVTRSQRPPVLLQMARVQLSLQRYNDGIATLQTLRKRLTPTHWMHRSSAALEIQIHRKRKSLPALLQDFQKRSKKQPALYLPLIPPLQQELGQDKKAIQSYLVLLKRDPKHPLLRNLIPLLHERQKYTLAQTLLQERLKQEPDDSRWALALIQTYHLAQKLKQRDSAIQTYRKQYMQQRVFLYKLLEKMEAWKLPRAAQLETFQALCSLPPQSVNCYERWGELLWKDGQKDKAFVTWEQIKKVRPYHPSHSYTLAKVFQKHGYTFQSQRLLETLYRKNPSYLPAQWMLADLYIRRRKPSKAIPMLQHVLNHTKGVQKRRQVRDDLLRAMLQLHDSKVLRTVLRRDYLLAPMKREPRKLLLRYHLRHAHRYRSYKKSKRKLQYYRWFSNSRPHYAVSYTSAFAKSSVPKFARNALQEGLRIYKNDPELHRIASKVYKDKPQALHHLRQLMLLDVSQITRNISVYRQQAHKLGQSRAMLPLLQRLSRRYPNRAHIWGELGQESLRHNKVQQAQQAYSRALRLDHKSFAYTCGLAQTFAEKKKWSKAFQKLSESHRTMSFLQKSLQLRRLVHYGLQQGMTSARLFRKLRKKVQRPTQAEADLQLAFALHRHTLPTDPSSEQAFLRFVLTQTYPSWRSKLKAEAPEKQRFQALLLLYAHKTQQFLDRVPQLLQDKHPPIRRMAALAIARHNQRERFSLLDRLERTDADETVRQIARFTSAALLGQFRSNELNSVIDNDLWQTFLLPYLQSSSFPQEEILMHMSRRYQMAPMFLRRHIFATIGQMSTAVLEGLNTLLTQTQQRCFAFTAFNHLRSKQARAELRDAANNVVLPRQFFYTHCSVQNLRAPSSILHVDACSQQ